jgi:transaldolase|tara:strand:- start:6133 stop:7176 length:1044 start_codon:yes stop_codon:yes gene_type:complete
MNNIEKLKNKGQSIWLDSISKQMIETGDIKKIIDEGITGITSNPSIFEKAIASTNSYDDLIEKFSTDTKNPKFIFEKIASEDIKTASDLLFEVYEKSKKNDGYVSLEVDPSLANNYKKTVEEAIKLWKLVDRPNLMIKIPGTNEGIKATKDLLEMGININITLLFSFESYKKTLDTFIASKKSNVDSRSVASFFISRIDTAADKFLTSEVNYLHKIATCNAYNAYKYFMEKKSSMGDNFQKLLWASTSVKSKDLSPEYYCVNLPMSDTVNTLPPETINHLLTSKNLDINKSLNINKEFEKNLFDSKQYFNLDDITNELLSNGIKLFQESYIAVLEKIERKIEKIIKK